MRQGLFGTAALVAVAAMSLAGCTGDAAAPKPSGSPSSTATPGPGTTLGGQVGHPGSDGLTVRRLDSAGGISTVRVEDFPR